MTFNVKAQIVVAQCYANFIHGNWSFLDELAENIIWIDPGFPEFFYPVECKGKTELMQYFAKLNETVEFGQYKQESFIIDGNRALTLGCLKGRVRATGIYFDHNILTMWTFKGAKISRCKTYNIPII